MPSRKKFSVYWTKSATLDLTSIIDYLSYESIENTKRILGKIERSTSRLTLFPHRGRVVPELKDHGILIYHELICLPWRVIYRMEGRIVWVMAVIDGRRNLEDLLLERFLH
jgi:plasmid stabilization system protein ParE